MKMQLSGVWRLTRFKEYVAFVAVTTVLGAAAGQGSFGWPLIGVLIANWLAVGFAFMINDVEDAPDDALTPIKAQRNPVSAGILSPRSARRASFIVAVIAALVYAGLGLGPFIAGLACLALAYYYSSRPIRLKAIPVADLVSHALLLAGLQFLAAYLTFDGGFVWQWVFPFVLVLALSVYGQLFNELRDLDGDLKAGVTHTASLLGSRAAHRLMMVCFYAGSISAFITILVVRLIPLWVLLVMVALAGLLFLYRLLSVGRAHSTIEVHQLFQKPVEVSAAVALTVWFAGPWIWSSLNYLIAQMLVW
jgi:4-hydroxybenzoate polyprenyltransferase